MRIYDRRQRPADERREKLKKGWLSEDIDMMLNACADDLVYDDPIDGRITKAQFADYYWDSLTASL